MVRRGRLVLMLAASAALMLPGCRSFLLPGGNIPDQLKVIVDDPAEFTPADNDPLQTIDAGTEIDAVSAASLDGCWGVYQPLVVTPTGTFDIYQSLHFDAATGLLTRMTYQNIGPLGTTVTVMQGAFTVDAAGTLTFTVTTVLSNNPLLGDILTDVTATYTTLPVYEIRLTLSGTQIKAVFEPTNGVDPDGFADNVELIHKQYVCP